MRTMVLEYAHQHLTMAHMMSTGRSVDQALGGAEGANRRMLAVVGEARPGGRLGELEPC